MAQAPHPCPFPKLRPSQLIRDDVYWMSMAFNQAIDAWNEDEVPVGAMIAWGDTPVAAARNRVIATNDPTAHAEIQAISQACAAIGDYRLNECTLYVTKEPCPMCAGACVMARLGRVVYGIADPKMGGTGGAIDLSALPTANHHYSVTAGVLEAECHAILQAFFAQKRSG